MQVDTNTQEETNDKKRSICYLLHKLIRYMVISVLSFMAFCGIRISP